VLKNSFNLLNIQGLKNAGGERESYPADSVLNCEHHSFLKGDVLGGPQSMR